MKCEKYLYFLNFKGERVGKARHFESWQCTIAATKFWPSHSCQLKKMDVVHALLSFVIMIDFRN
jgi:hypothetical protein